MDILRIKNVKEVSIVGDGDTQQIIAFDGEGNLVKAVEGGGNQGECSCNIGQLYADFEDNDGNGNYWRYSFDDGFDGFNYVHINASFYGEQKYNQGYNIGFEEGKNASQNVVEFEYIEPEKIVDMVLNQGFTGTLVIKGQITEVQSIDLNYGNATYMLGDLKVFRGTGLNHNSIMEEDFFQVGDWVVIVGNVSNYNGTAQIDRGSTLVAKWRETIIEPNKWGIVGYFNSWGGTPDIQFQDAGFTLTDLGYEVKFVKDFYCDGQEIKFRYNNSWNISVTTNLYNEPQIVPALTGDNNIQLSEGYWDIYLLGYDNGQYWQPHNILILASGTDVFSIPTNASFGLYSNYPVMWRIYSDYDGNYYYDVSEPTTEIHFPVWYNNTYSIQGFDEFNNLVFNETILWDGSEYERWIN